MAVTQDSENLDHVKLGYLAARLSTFVSAASQISESKPETSLHDTLTLEILSQRVSHFLEKAKPIVLDEIVEVLTQNHDALFRAACWMVPEQYNILKLAGFRYLENPYTNLLAWLLDAEGNKDLALKIQKLWLKQLGLEEIASKLIKSGLLLPQFNTSAGRPDLVLYYRDPGFVLVIESKTDSQEHLVPGGEYQTQAYLPALKRSLQLNPAFPGRVVFLTLNHAKPKFDQAIAATFQDFAWAVTQALDPKQINSDHQSAIKIVISEFLFHNTALKVLPALLAEKIVGDGVTLKISEKFILSRVDEFVELTLFLRGIKNEI